MRHLDRAVGDGQQPALREPRDDLRVLPFEGSATRRRTTVPPSSSPLRRRNSRAGLRLLRRVQRHVGVLGQPGDRALDAAGAGIRGELQVAPFTPAPELEQRRRQQRQRPRLAFDVGQQRVDEVRGDRQADPLRRPLDRAPQLVA